MEVQSWKFNLDLQDAPNTQKYVLENINFCNKLIF